VTQSLRIAVLGGGRSSEHDVSLASSASVAEGLERGGHEVRRIEIGRDGVWRTGGEVVALTPGRGLDGVDVVFPVLHGPFGEDGTVQGLLECLDVAYVGAGVLASALCMDKVVFKELMGAAGIPQVDYRAVRVERFRADRVGVRSSVAALGLPVWVKPARLGSSVGIAPASTADELPRALEAAFAHDPLAIVEASARGLEIECSVLGNSSPIASEPGEISLSTGGSGWYDYEAKYSPGGMQLVIPARISSSAREQVRSLAVETFLHAGCSGFARVDFFVDGETVLVNELNTIPGFTQTSVFAALFEASGISYVEVLDRLVRLAVERYESERRHRH
jgi:D-alanine-D-alanine ligase